ncbi:SCO family protein [Thermanaerothrix sp. 4228-RoL]|uniref:SCO family protein n=1 Tax=Thermanaerothrix solaris TaxID=3058434 RepID=A0ABU3NIT0_9CHLR|nr:SCO family protein [Thermanaerothrix sp. 4228-RoL]MDT8896697.1 SCO family protein [Thermanaerothrix sp. 4228-RoL]
MRQYSLLIGIGIVAVALVAVGLLLRPQGQFRGSLLDPPIPAPDFSLTQANGKTFTLSAQKEKVVLLFFGYTYCPDVCPTTLADLAQVMKRLGRQSERVRVVFISVDPQRDTPERAQSYAAAFDPSFIGLSGTEADLQPVWNAYGVYRLVRDSESRGSDYLVDHSARVYLIDGKGNLRLTYSFGTPVEDLENDLRLILREK